MAVPTTPVVVAFVIWNVAGLKVKVTGAEVIEAYEPDPAFVAVTEQVVNVEAPRRNVFAV
jgi:hypothetical protein